MTLVGLLAVGCAGETAPAAEGEPPVIAPGRPGEEARTLAPEEAREAGSRAEGEAGEADFAFMRMMILHHEQALVMTDLAAEHAEDAKVGRLSERVAAAQGPEIEVMKAWLVRHGEDAGKEDGGHHDHGHHDAEGSGAAAMPGMAAGEELAELHAARGKEFDLLFLDLMIAHHEGAVAMAADLLAESTDVEAGEMATKMIAEQTVEIGRMKGLRAPLAGGG
ncbi:DUF305 domain-containing protein [Streptomyces sodiiphilus]|uniref:DUF305 domain-containing protein n=1 Tax=Streptomyces sodiiphilus TaxID=226217 RepID=A0ABN2NT86_9ACTN